MYVSVQGESLHRQTNNTSGWWWQETPVEKAPSWFGAPGGLFEKGKLFFKRKLTDEQNAAVFQAFLALVLRSAVSGPPFDARCASNEHGLECRVQEGAASPHQRTLGAWHSERGNSLAEAAALSIPAVTLALSVCLLFWI
jgi:hypothetical protein